MAATPDLCVGGVPDARSRPVLTQFGMLMEDGRSNWPHDLRVPTP